MGFKVLDIGLWMAIYILGLDYFDKDFRDSSNVFLVNRVSVIDT